MDINPKTQENWWQLIQDLPRFSMNKNLDSLKDLATKLGIQKEVKTIIVGGTNGKGSCVAILESIARASGVDVGSFTSPVLFNPLESIRINGKTINSEAFCKYCNHIAKNADCLLCQSEFMTLVALIALQESKVTLQLLEVGIGGRLDPVNIVDGDVSIITTIGFDHTNLLGNTRESIALEKSGIFRCKQLVVCGDPNPPSALTEVAQKLSCQLSIVGSFFSYEKQENSWSYQVGEEKYIDLPIPSLALQNAATAITGWLQLYPIQLDVLKSALRNVYLPGRFEVLHGDITRVFDVAHNLDSVRYLLNQLKDLNIKGSIHALFSSFKGKDIEGMVSIMVPLVSYWHIAPIKDPRGASVKKMKESMQKVDCRRVKAYSSINEAKKKICGELKKGDCLIVFGSFKTVEEARS